MNVFRANIREFGKLGKRCKLQLLKLHKRKPLNVIFINPLNVQ